MRRVHLAVALLGCASRAVGVALEGAAARVDTACRAAIGASPRQAYDRLLPAFGALECFGASTRCALPVPLLPIPPPASSIEPEKCGGAWAKADAGRWLRRRLQPSTMLSASIRMK